MTSEAMTSEAMTTEAMTTGATTPQPTTTTTMAPKPPPNTWVIGAGGLLGGALRRCLIANGATPFESTAVQWQDPPVARDQLRRAVHRLLDRSRSTGGRWQIAWCAGAGVTGSTDTELDDELSALRSVLEAVGERIAAGTADPAAGSVFVASSAGGVYAGSSSPPFTEAHPTAPTSAYGRAKLAAEATGRSFARATGVPTVIGRITNLYGPGQNLQKPQGLISHLCRTQLTRRPISIYVSLDTIRDYLFVDDCADMVRLALAGAREAVGPDDPFVTKIFAAQQGVTIGSLIGEFRRVFKRAPQVILGTSSTARYQAGDLRVQSIVWPELDQRTMTSLPAGIAATAEDLFRTVQLAG